MSSTSVYGLPWLLSGVSMSPTGGQVWLCTVDKGL